MTVPGQGGVQIRAVAYKDDRFKRDYKKLSQELQARVHDVLRLLVQDTRLGSLRFHKLHGYKNPAVYTIDLTTNRDYKISLSIEGDRAILRRVATHKEIDRRP
jgi:hypothetical protein